MSTACLTDRRNQRTCGTYDNSLKACLLPAMLLHDEGRLRSALAPIALRANRLGNGTNFHDVEPRIAALELPQGVCQTIDVV